MELNKIYNEDCILGMKKIEDNSIDLVVTDPPYYINYQSNDWDKTSDFVKSTEEWVSEVFRVLKPTGTLWSCMGYQQVFDFVPLLNKYGTVQLKNWTIWAHSKGRGSSKHLKSLREDIFHITKDSKKYVWNEMKTLREVIAPYVKDGKPRGWFLADIPNEDGEIMKKRVRWTGLGNVWCYNAPQHNSIAEHQFHPSQKPVMMMERMIRLSSNEGDTVLDPFMGSGTTAIAAKISNRNFIGFEQNKEYFDYASNRIDMSDISTFKEYNKTIDDMFKTSNEIPKIEKELPKIGRNSYYDSFFI